MGKHTDFNGACACCRTQDRQKEALVEILLNRQRPAGTHPAGRCR